MAISPILLLWLLVSSFLFGAAVGALNDVFRLSRVLLGVRYSARRWEKLYRTPLPFLKRSLRSPSDTPVARRLLPILIFAQDVLLFVFAGVGTAVLNYYFNHGRFRFYTVLAVLAGFLLYYLTVGKLVMLLSEPIAFFVRACVCLTVFLIFRPFVIFFEFLGKSIKKIGENIQKTIANRRKKVYNIGKRKEVMRQAKQGFLEIANDQRAKKQDGEAS